MSTTAAPTAPSTLRGGEWLLQPSSSDSLFTPEKLTDEHRLIGRTAQEFVQNEILPVLDTLEQKDWDARATAGAARRRPRPVRRRRP